MPGPGRKAATEATLRMPPRCRARLSTKASDNSVSARMLRSIMPSCSLRSRAAAVVIECTVELMGEMIKVDRLVLGRGGLGDQLVGRDIVERETLFDHGVELVALAWQHFAVDRRGVHQHGG